MRDRNRRTQMEGFCLPPELLEKILARLPPKTLLKFRSVCRNWRSFIDSSYFISLHMNLYSNKSAKTQLLTIESIRGTSLSVNTLALRRSETFSKIAYLSNYPESMSIYSQTCMVHGLIALSNKDCFMLCNPSIRKFFTLPCCPLKCNRLTFARLLGYSASNDDFKVVAFDVIDPLAFEVAIAIYSLRDHSWRENRIQATERCISLLSMMSPKKVYFQGAVYWMPKSVRGHAVDTGLMYFDFDAEKFGHLKLPYIDEDMKSLPFIYGGSLAIFGTSSVRSCIWVLEKNAGNELWHQCWSKYTGKDVYGFFENYSYLNCRMWHIEETDTLLFYKSLSDKLMAYNIRSDDIQIQYLGKHIPFVYVDIYVESLVLHNEYEGAIVQNG